MIDRDSYYTGLVCLNGHPVTDRLEDLTARAAPFCGRCGEPTISRCPGCDAAIRGDYVPPENYLHVLTKWSPPAHCHNCGSAYPWTERGLMAARELIDGDDTLQEADKTSLKASLDALTRDTPDSPGAALKFKRISAKMGKEAVGALKTIMIAIATEYARRQIFP